LGIGAGAHSKLSFQDYIMRQARFKHPARYMAQVQSGSAIEQEHTLTFRDLPLEFMMNALRLTEGFDIELFQLRTGLPAGKISKRVALAEARGLLQRNGPILQPTLQGQRFLNELLQLFMD
ncbi:MAG: oxygen-independent coproporphyrinogen III oxidase-like protein, partial [Methylobacterium sp.]|nr:oxygen-independent coproporphyrinogen III oxidase-like protein [Methylobacterium sp.]